MSLFSTLKNFQTQVTSSVRDGISRLVEVEGNPSIDGMTAGESNSAGSSSSSSTKAKAIVVQDESSLSTRLKSLEERCARLEEERADVVSFMIESRLVRAPEDGSNNVPVGSIKGRVLRKRWNTLLELNASAQLAAAKEPDGSVFSPGGGPSSTDGAVSSSADAAASSVLAADIEVPLLVMSTTFAPETANAAPSASLDKAASSDAAGATTAAAATAAAISAASKPLLEELEALRAMNESLRLEVTRQKEDYGTLSSKSGALIEKHKALLAEAKELREAVATSKAAAAATAEAAALASTQSKIDVSAAAAAKKSDDSSASLVADLQERLANVSSQKSTLEVELERAHASLSAAAAAHAAEARAEQARREALAAADQTQRDALVASLQKDHEGKLRDLQAQIDQGAALLSVARADGERQQQEFERRFKALHSEQKAALKKADAEAVEVREQLERFLKEIVPLNRAAAAAAPRDAPPPAAAAAAAASPTALQTKDLLRAAQQSLAEAESTAAARVRALEERHASVLTKMEGRLKRGEEERASLSQRLSDSADAARGGEAAAVAERGALQKALKESERLREELEAEIERERGEHANALKAAVSAATAAAASAVALTPKSTDAKVEGEEGGAAESAVALDLLLTQCREQLEEKRAALELLETKLNLAVEGHTQQLAEAAVAARRLGAEAAEYKSAYEAATSRAAEAATTEAAKTLSRLSTLEGALAEALDRAASMEGDLAAAKTEAQNAAELGSSSAAQEAALRLQLTREREEREGERSRAAASSLAGLEEVEGALSAARAELLAVREGAEREAERLSTAVQDAENRGKEALREALSAASLAQEALEKEAATAASGHRDRVAALEASLKRVQEELAAKGVELSALQHHLPALTQQIRRLEAELAGEKSNAAALSVRTAELEVALKDARAEIVAAEAARAAGEAAAVARSAELSTLRGKVAELEETLRTVVSANAEVGDVSSALRGEVSLLKGQLEAASSALGEQQKTAEELEAALEEAKAARARTTTRAREKLSSLAESHAVDLNALRQELSERVANLEAEKAAMALEAAEIRQRLLDAQVASSTQEARRIIELEAQLSEWMSASKDTQRQLSKQLQTTRKEADDALSALGKREADFRHFQQTTLTQLTTAQAEKESYARRITALQGTLEQERSRFSLLETAASEAAHATVTVKLKQMEETRETDRTIIAQMKRSMQEQIARLRSQGAAEQTRAEMALQHLASAQASRSELAATVASLQAQLRDSQAQVDSGKVQVQQMMAQFVKLRGGGGGLFDMTSTSSSSPSFSSSLTPQKM